MKTTQSKSESVAIEGISEATILHYFETLNTGDFEATANLFAPDGILKAPFEEPLVGREAIATYLNTEAKGMKLIPQEGIIEPLEDNLTKFHLQGKVQTALFGVNVAWKIILNCAKEIVSVEVKLLASLQELVSLRR
jgi:ketosteroid isomerase-like protein